MGCDWDDWFAADAADPESSNEGSECRKMMVDMMVECLLVLFSETVKIVMGELKKMKMVKVKADSEDYLMFHTIRKKSKVFWDRGPRNGIHLLAWYGG